MPTKHDSAWLNLIYVGENMTEVMIFLFWLEHLRTWFELYSHISRIRPVSRCGVSWCSLYACAVRCIHQDKLGLVCLFVQSNNILHASWISRQWEKVGEWCPPQDAWLDWIKPLKIDHGGSQQGWWEETWIQWKVGWMWHYSRRNKDVKKKISGFQIIVYKWQHSKNCKLQSL